MRISTLVVMLTLLAGPLFASTSVTFESFTVSTTAVGFADGTTSPTGFPQINRCSLTVEGADVRYRWSIDSVAPTATVGQILADGQTLTIESHEDARRIQFIRDAGVNATIQVHCWQQAAR